MNFFADFTQLRQNPTDVTYFPHRQLASKVFSMVEQTYMKSWDNPIRLRPDVSPEMLESCFSRIFGKIMMTQVIERLPILMEKLKDHDIDDLWLSLVGQRKLLAQVAEQAAWGSRATEDAEELAFLIFCITGGDMHMIERFVGQATKRIATVH